MAPTSLGAVVDVNTLTLHIKAVLKPRSKMMVQEPKLGDLVRHKKSFTLGMIIETNHQAICPTYARYTVRWGFATRNDSYIITKCGSHDIEIVNESW